MLYLAEGLLEEGHTYNFWGEFVNMLLTLGVILALIFVSVWFLKKLMRSRLTHLNRSTGIRVLERRALTPKSSLYLVDILGKGVVIAESQAGIQMITEFAQGEDVEHLLEQLQQENSRPAGESLIQKIKKGLSKRSNA